MLLRRANLSFPRRERARIPAEDARRLRRRGVERCTIGGSLPVVASPAVPARLRRILLRAAIFSSLNRKQATRARHY